MQKNKLNLNFQQRKMRRKNYKSKGINQFRIIKLVKVLQKVLLIIIVNKIEIFYKVSLQKQRFNNWQKKTQKIYIKVNISKTWLTLVQSITKENIKNKSKSHKNFSSENQQNKLLDRNISITRNLNLIKKSRITKRKWIIQKSFYKEELKS